MEDLTVFLEAVETSLQNNVALLNWAAALKADEPGSAGEWWVQLGNDQYEVAIPLSHYPFVLVTVGNETSREEGAMGELISRMFKFQVGFFDNNTRRGTLRSVELEKVFALEVFRALRDLMVGPDNPDGLIVDFRIDPILTDQDVNRPAILRMIPVEVDYTL